jgi:iron complex outermembrane receptor protein
VTEELQFQGRSADGRFNWQAGGYLEISNPIKNNTQWSELFVTCPDISTLQCISPFGANGALTLLDQRYNFRNIAGYAQGTYAFTDKLSLTAGIRYTSDHTEAVSRNVTVSGFPTPFVVCSIGFRPIASVNGREACSRSYVQKSSRPTWLINLDYKPNEDVLLYAKYARGYRQGLINLLPLTETFTTTRPEKVDTFEVGAKTSFDSFIRGTFNIAAFYNNFSDQQIQANLFTTTGRLGTNAVVNAGKSRIWGIEVDASLRVFEGFRLDLGYAYLNTKLVSITPPNLAGDPNYSRVELTAAVDGPLAYSPKHRLTVTGTYTLPLEESIGRVSVGVTYTYTSEQFGTRANDVLVPVLGYNLGLLPATNLVNLNLNWDSVGGLPIDLSAFVTNLTNEKYHFAIGGVASLAGYESFILGEPRMFGARLRYRFGR